MEVLQGLRPRATTRREEVSRGSPRRLNANRRIRVQLVELEADHRHELAIAHTVAVLADMTCGRTRLHRRDAGWNPWHRGLITHVKVQLLEGTIIPTKPRPRSTSTTQFLATYAVCFVLATSRIILVTNCVSEGRGGGGEDANDFRQDKNQWRNLVLYRIILMTGN